MAPETTAATLQPPALPPGTRRNPYLIPVWLLLTLNIYWLYWLYRTYKEVRAHAPGATSVSPGRAVGFLFIPLFNLYWIFRIAVDFPRAIARMQRADPRGEEVLCSPAISVLFVLCPILIAASRPLGNARLFLLGEGLLCCVFVACQVALNAHWRGSSVAPPTHARSPSAGDNRFAQLIGVSGPLDWARISVYTAAICSSYVVLVLLRHLALVSLAAEGVGDLLTLENVLKILGQGLAVAAATVVAFRLLSNLFAAAALAGLLSGVVLVAFSWPATVPEGIAFAISEFVTFLALAAAVQWLRPTGLALFAASLASSAWYTTAYIAFLFGWRALMVSEPEGFKQSLLFGLANLTEAAALTGVLLLGLKLLGRNSS